MLIAISALSDDLNLNVDYRFGRSRGFIIYNTEDDMHRYIDNNQNLQAAQGAGIQTAQNIINSGAKAVIVGNCGPKAFAVLSAGGIKVYSAGGGSIKDAIAAFKAGQLAEMSGANVQGHFGYR